MAVMLHQERVAHRTDIWARWFDATLADAFGWNVGWCPLHDAAKQELGSAEFNFNNGTFRCTAKPRCHNRGGMSLQQLGDEIIKRGIA